MSDDKNDLTVWRTDQNNQWGLYKNTDYQLPLVKDEDATDKNEKPKIKAQSDTPFYFSKLKQEIKGTMICTPKGYGIIQSIDPVKNFMSVKVQGTIYDFDRNEISNEIPLQMIYLKNSVKIEEIVYLSAASTIKELFEKMEASLEASGNVLDIKLFYKGKELEKSDDTIEKLRIAPLSKFLATYVPGKPMCVNRFTSAHSGWCVGGSGVDGITFQASKNIRVIGFGVYPGTSQEVLAGSGKLYHGENTKGTMVSSVELEMLKSKDASDNEPQRVLFGKPYLLKAGESCSVTLTFPNSGNSYYGSGGQLKVDGEGDVQFTFKNCDGSYNGTGTGSGQIPTIYYYV